MKLILCAATCLVALAAYAQPLPPPGGASGNGTISTIYTYGNSTGVGNGADTTEDTLLTFNIPAGTLAAVGDRIRIFANGSFAASTDTKTARIRLTGTGSALQGISGVAAGNTAWSIYMEVQKTGASSQQQASYSIVASGGVNVISAALTLVDTAAIVLTVTGQNSTTATANTITVKYATVEYQP